jgi:hypothetical protein
VATVRQDAETGLYRTYIGGPAARNPLGRHDSSQKTAVRKAEEFLLEKRGIFCDRPSPDFPQA